MFDGRLPSKTRCGTSQSGVPSALTSLGGLAEGERLGLGEDVGHQHVVMAAERIERFDEGDEVAGDEPRALVDQLVEGMLAVGAGLAPVDRAGVVVDVGAVERDVLAVALHRELLQVGGEALEVLLVGQNGDGLGAEEVGVPDGEQAHAGRAGSGRTERCGSARPSAWKPASIARKLAGPMASIVERPMAESIE